MSILITGGTGFIGAEIVRMLVAEGREDVIVAHRSGNFERIEDVLDKVQTVQADLGDDDAVAKLVADTSPTQLFHFGATLTGPGEADPQGLLRSNVSGVITLFEAARKAGTEQIIFASSIGTYGRDLVPDEPVNDMSQQRPNTIYGVTKVFAENLGAYYRSKHGIDFRGLRYPSIVGPGVTTKSLAQYTSWMIEAAAKGEPFSVWTGPETVIPILYYKDAAKAALDLAAAPLDDIKTINYLVDGARPTPNAGEIAEAVKGRAGDAAITFDPDPEAALSLSRNLVIDDAVARQEWGWNPAFGLDGMIDDFFAEVRG
ncbi:MAG: threonine 3-dehydrogenase [Acidimicrobiales bacterium]|jgi:threonine 3-dehydrogenase